MLARHTPLRAKTPMRRTAPIRKVARKAVSRGIKPDADALAYWATLGDICMGCSRHGGTVVHHILANAPCKSGRRDHMLVVKLCPDDHNMGTNSVHLLGSEAAFLAKTGVDLVAIAVANRDDYLLGELL
jgi:hypothetical protein